ncbi:MAG: outer membrane beta-barrel protein [Acidobacteriaceae bacterium]|nr:outer membrane beta-barrel protein [Acidobacteriaceae bacterium]
MKAKLGTLVVMLLAAMVGSLAHAQVAPYAMFSLGHYSGLGVGAGTQSNQSGGYNSLGGTFGVYDDFIHAGAVGAGLDVRGIIQNSSNSTQYGNKTAGFLFGPRVTVNTLALPFRPYAQLEIGSIGTNNGTQSSKDAHFGYQFQFGGDFTLLPHLAARFEYGIGQVDTPNIKHTLQTFGAGLVLRL